MGCNVQIIVPDIPFTITSDLGWPEGVVPPGDLYYQVLYNGAVITSGSTPATDDDGLLVESISVSDVKIATTGDLALTVNLGWDEAFTATSDGEFTGFVVIGGLTVLPPICAILLAFISGDVLLALFIGVWVAAFLVCQYNPAAALLRTLDTYITNAFATDYRIQIILLSWFMAGMISMLYKAGGGHGMANAFARIAKSRRSVQLSAFLLGCVIFFDDYSSCLLVGMTMRPLTDAMLIRYVWSMRPAPSCGWRACIWSGLCVCAAQRL